MGQYRLIFRLVDSNMAVCFFIIKFGPLNPKCMFKALID